MGSVHSGIWTRPGEQVYGPALGSKKKVWLINEPRGARMHEYIRLLATKVQSLDEICASVPNSVSGIKSAIPLYRFFRGLSVRSVISSL